MIFFSLLLFALSGRRILRVRAKVNKAQARLQPEQSDRNSFRNFRRLSGSKSPIRTNTNNTSHITDSHTPRTGSELVSRQVTDMRDPQSIETATTIAPSDSANSTAPFREQLSHESYFDSRPTIQRTKSARFETVHWKYAKFTFLCTIVLFITWIPISINRVYNNFIRPDHPIYGMYFASALCIPLHGFGNFIIYVNTSWPECRAWVMSLFAKPKKSGGAVEQRI